MNFVTVDNNNSRLKSLTELLKKTFPFCNVTEFTDPLMSAKFIYNNEIDAVLVESVMRPADDEMLKKVIISNKPDIKVIILSEEDVHMKDSNELVRPITSNQLKMLLCK